MNFQDLTIKKEYRSLLDNVAKDFYIPLLSCATKYQRAVGFFSSSCLVEISKGISELAKNGGKIREVAESLAACGVNELLLSVDCFHNDLFF